MNAMQKKSNVIVSCKIDKRKIRTDSRKWGGRSFANENQEMARGGRKGT